MDSVVKEHVVISVDGERMFDVTPRMAASLIDLVLEWEHTHWVVAELVKTPA